jgi:hypothetical protein
MLACLPYDCFLSQGFCSPIKKNSYAAEQCSPLAGSPAWHPEDPPPPELVQVRSMQYCLEVPTPALQVNPPTHTHPTPTKKEKENMLPWTGMRALCEKGCIPGPKGTHPTCRLGSPLGLAASSCSFTRATNSARSACRATKLQATKLQATELQGPCIGTEQLFML